MFTKCNLLFVHFFSLISFLVLEEDFFVSEKQMEERCPLLIQQQPRYTVKTTCATNKRCLIPQFNWSASLTIVPAVKQIKGFLLSLLILYVIMHRDVYLGSKPHKLSIIIN